MAARRCAFSRAASRRRAPASNEILHARTGIDEVIDMDSIRSAVLGIGIVAAVASAPANATPDVGYVQLNGAGMCTLSIPTIDTKVRPKATGFRNEGTTTAFVICNFTSLPGFDGSVNFGDPQAVALLLYSMDGNDHTVTCTGVTSIQGLASIGANPQQYVTKTLTVNNTTEPYKAAGVAFKWL